MPSKRNATKKGRLNGNACKELNTNASSKAVERTILGTNEDTVFGRVTRMLGFGHMRVLVQGSAGTRELSVRIPKGKFGKRGATPITTNSVVSIFVGKDFDASAKVYGAEHFDVTAIMDDRQVRDLVSRRCLPSWMLKSVDEITSGVPTTTEEEGFEWEVTEEVGNAMTKKELREAKKTQGKQEADAEESLDDMIDSI